MANNSEPYETAIKKAEKVRYEPNETAIKKAEKVRYEPNEAAIQNEGARSAPESGLMKKKFSPKDMKKIRKIKMSFSTRLIPRFFLIRRRFCYIFPFALYHHCDYCTSQCHDLVTHFFSEFLTKRLVAF